MLSPVFRVAYTEVCYIAYVKTSRLCHTESRAWNGTYGEVSLSCLKEGGEGTLRIPPRVWKRDVLGMVLVYNYL